MPRPSDPPLYVDTEVDSGSNNQHFIFGPTPKTHLPPLDRNRSRSRPSSSRPSSARPRSARPGSAGGARGAGGDREGDGRVEVKTHTRRRVLCALLVLAAVLGGLTPSALKAWREHSRTPAVDARAVYVEAGLQFTAGLTVTPTRPLRPLRLALPRERGGVWAGGRVHTPSRVPHPWGATSCERGRRGKS
jgi:hypothetical protein